MRAYLEVLRHGRARAPILTSAVSRFTSGMMALSLVLSVREGGYPYAIAGTVTGAHALGIGVGSPFQGRLADRYGHPRVLVPDAFAYLAGTVALLIGIGRGWPVPVLVVLAFATGAMQPPTTACSRSLLGRLFTSGRLRETAFAVTSITVEFGFIVGPLLVVGIAAAAGARWALLLAGVFAAIGALGYSATPAVRDHVNPRRAPDRQGALRSVGLRVMVATYAAIAMSFGVFDLVAAAVAEVAEVPSAAGTLISSIAAGSLVGGAFYGARVWPGTPLARLRVLVPLFAVAMAAIPFSLHRLSIMMVVVFLVGMTIGPMNIVAFQLIHDLAPVGTHTEAQSWTQAAVFAGSAVGSAIGGGLIDVGGPFRAMVFGVVMVAAAAVVVHAGRGLLARSPGAGGGDHPAPAVAPA